MANTRPNGKGTRPRVAVGRDALIPPHPAAAQGSAGGINPSPTNHGRPSAKRAKRGPAVISGLCRGRCLHRPAGPVAAQGSAGGPWPSPTNRGEHLAKREGHTPPGGRRAGCPHPAAPRGGGNTRGRDKSLPYEPRQARGQPGKTRPRVITNPCRGRCLHCARRRVSEANRAIGPALRPEIVPGTPQRGKVPREGYGPPLQTMANARPNGAAPGRCFHSGRGRAFYGVVVTGNVKTVIRRPAALRGPARRCGS